MLHLDTRIHFDKIMAAVLVHEELHGTRTAVIDVFCQFDRIIAHRLSLFLGNRQSRRKFHNLLMTALNRTVSLVEMHDIAVLIAQHLNFDMFRLFQILLDKDIIDAESFSRFALLRLLNSVIRSSWISYDTHPASAAAGRRFQHNRITAESANFFASSSDLIASSTPGIVGTPTS